MISGDIKGLVKNFWNNSPCGIRDIYSKEGTKEFFEEIEKKRYELEPFLPKIVQFERWKGKKVLEIGSGIGTDFIQFFRGGADAHGIDFSENSVSLTRKRLSLYGFNENRIFVADAEDLPFNDHQFDFVYSWGVLHHTPNIKKAISEIYRVLKPSGEICIMLYHKFSLVVLQLYLLFGILQLNPFRNIDEIIANHLESPGTRAFTKAQAKKMFERFNDVEIDTVVTCYDLRYMRDKQKRDKFLPYWVGKLIPSFLGWFMVIKGRK